MTHTKKRDDYGFSHFAENIEDYAIVLLNSDGIIEDWNKGAQNIKGYEGAEIIGTHFSSFYTEADRQSNFPQKLLDQASKNGKTKSEGWRVRKDGSTFWGSVSITAIKNEQGEVEGYVKITRDLSERRKNEELLLQKNAMLLEAERLAKMCSWTWDVATDSFGWSEAACDIFNMRIDYSLNYERLLKIIHEADKAIVKQAIDDAVEHSITREFSFRIVDNNKQVKDVLVCIGKITHNDNGTVRRITGTLQDITEKMSYVNHIREKNRNLAEIAQLQSHIVRSQVANILGICEVFDIDNMNTPENKELIQELKRSTEKLDSITRNIVNKTYEGTPVILPGEWI